MIRARRAAAKAVALVAAASGLTVALRRRRRRRSDYRLFILEYHDVSDGPEREGIVSAARFRRHLRYLKRHYRFDRLSRAAQRLREPERLEEDLVAVTFDDGYAGNARFAWPALAAEGVSATVFLTTGFLDGAELWFDVARRGLGAALGAGTALPPELMTRLLGAFGRWPPRGGLEAALERLKSVAPEERSSLVAELRGAPLELPPAAEPLTWEEARKMCGADIELGAHTVSHPILPALSRARQEEEILRSRERIAEETGTAPETFAYPNGDFDADTVEVVRAAGFAAACTTRKGSNHHGADLLTLRRLGVGSDPDFLLAARLAGFFDEELRRYFAT